MTEETPSTLSWWQRRNWWKIAFFFLLIVFEITREGLVLANNDEPKLLVRKFVFGSDGYVSAEGRWRRTDGGEPLIQSITVIRCTRDEGTCRVTDVQVKDDYVFAPETAEYPAKFFDNGAAYSSQAGCVRYDVRIDANTQQATKVRRILPPNEQMAVIDCDYVMDDRIDMVLTDARSLELGDFDVAEDSFLPILRLVQWVSGNDR